MTGYPVSAATVPFFLGGLEFMIEIADFERIKSFGRKLKIND